MSASIIQYTYTIYSKPFSGVRSRSIADCEYKGGMRRGSKHGGGVGSMVYPIQQSQRQVKNTHVSN